MEQNKIRSYLLYALGEVILVVLGILIALQVNNWNEAQKERKVEKQLLEQIHGDLIGASYDITYNSRFLDQAIRSADLVIQHMDGNEAYHDSIGAHISKIFTWTKFVIDTGGYESMKSEGIDIISNADLRNRIINLFEGRLYFHREFEKMIAGRTEYLINQEGAKYFKGMNQGFGIQNGSLSLGLTEPLDYEVLRKDASFRYHVLTMKSMTQGFKQLSNTAYKKRIQDLILSIENEIAES